MSDNAIFNNSGILTNNGTFFNDAYYLPQRLTNSGTLINNGTIDGAGSYTQTAGQTINNGSMTQWTGFSFTGGSLSGTGTMTGDVTLGNGASLHPGNSPGTLTINGTFSSSGNFSFDIGGLEDGQYSVLRINGDAIFSGGNIEFDFIDGFLPKPGDSWDFLFADTITNWDLLSFSLVGLDGSKWQVGHLHEIGNDILRLQITGPPVPLPSTVLLLGSGLLGLGAVGWRRRRS